MCATLIMINKGVISSSLFTPLKQVQHREGERKEGEWETERGKRETERKREERGRVGDREKEREGERDECVIS